MTKDKGQRTNDKEQRKNYNGMDKRQWTKDNGQKTVRNLIKILIYSG